MRGHRAWWLGVAGVIAACGGGGGDEGGAADTAESTPASPSAPVIASTTKEAPVPPVLIAFVGDLGTTDATTANLREIAASDASLLLALGDLSYSDEAETTWCDYVQDQLGPSFPVQLVAGNHEDDVREDGHIGAFAECLPDRMSSTGTYGAQYYFDLPDLARVILLSPDLTIDGHHYFYGDNNADILWVEAAIDGARSAGLPWVIVGTHKPCLSVGEYYCLMYQELFDLLVAKRVDLLISGHDHNYQRSHQVGTRGACGQVVVDEHDPECVVDNGSDRAYAQGGGAVAIVAGTGGAELYDVHDDDSEAGYFATSMGANENASFGHVRLTLTEKELRGEFVAVAGGTFEDSFVIAAS